MRRVLFVFAAAAVLFGCSDVARKGDKYKDLRYREEFLLSAGMVYYGQDPMTEGFDDMYYAFMADKSEMAEAARKAKSDFKQEVDAMPASDRAFLEYVYNDYADLAVMADYAYRDSKVRLPEGWVDMSEKDPKLDEIIEKYTVSGRRPSGLKCSLMAKGERRVLVFAGTDFPSSWKDMYQVMHFIIDAYEDVNGALNADASQVVLARRLVTELMEEGYVNKEALEFAGHSLGGRLASEMSVQFGCPAVLFNAAGVSPSVYEKYEEARESADKYWRGYIVDVISANDPLTCAQKYMSGSSDPFVSAASDLLSVDRETVDGVMSLGLGILGAVVENVSGSSELRSSKKGLKGALEGMLDKYYERDYRALGAMMPIRENMGGHGIKELAAALRTRAELCAD